MVWVGDTVTERQDWYLLWADLSLLNTADATPGPLPCTPSALPVEPSAAPATPATSPSPAAAAGDVSSWPTYEDTEQRYRLRYPAGATIATDQSGYTTFTLTDNQTTYTVEVRGQEAPTWLDRPASILDAVHQNMGSLFDISEIQELTINGVQAALVAYSYSDGREPCGTRRSQMAAFLSVKQLYELTFAVAGPGQCDATAVPWFEQMLHSFEPY